MYVRFVIQEKDGDSGRNMGLFAAMGQLERAGDLYQYEIELKNELSNWFDRHLDAPTVQASDSNYYRNSRAISWFKEEATRHIEKMRQYAQILETHGVHVDRVTTERPGRIVYEDAFQIAAIPFKDTFR